MPERPLQFSAVHESLLRARQLLSRGALMGSMAAIMPLVRITRLDLTLFRAVDHVDEIPEARAYLARTEAALALHRVRAESRVERGEPAASILRHLKGGGYDFAALATHGRRGLSRLLAGSVTEEVVWSSEVPLIVNRPPENQASFSVRVAVYRRGMPVDTVEQRRAAFQGMVAWVIHGDALIVNLFGAQLSNDFEVTVHDAGPWDSAHSEPPSKRNLLYDSRSLGGAEASVAGGPLRQESIIEVAGRKWRLSFSLPPGVRGAERTLLVVVLAGSLLTSLLLFGVVWALLVSRERALRLAQHATAERTAEDLREQLAFIQQLIEAVPQPIFFKDAEKRRYLGVNKAWERFFGIPREQFIGKSVFELYPDNPEIARKHHAKDEELFASWRLDNLTSTHAGISALIAATGTGPNVPVLASFNYEEIGSMTYSAAQSPFLETVLRRLL